HPRAPGMPDTPERAGARHRPAGAHKGHRLGADRREAHRADRAARRRARSQAGPVPARRSRRLQREASSSPPGPNPAPVSTIDGEASPAERNKLHSVLKNGFNLDDEGTVELIDEASAADRDAVDLYHFTSLINRSLDEAGRRRIVEMMWEIIYADGRVSEFEENVIWRASDLLGISSRERIEIGRRIAAERAPSGNDRCTLAQA